MAAKTDAQLKTDNNNTLSKADNRHNHLTALKTLVDDVIDSKKSTGTTESLTATQIGFGSASNSITSESSLIWNSTSKRIGIGSIINSQYGLDSVNPDGSSVIHAEAQGSGSRFAGYVAVVPSTSTSCAYFQLKTGFNLLQAQMHGSGSTGLSLGVPIADNALFFSTNDRNLIISASGAAATGNIVLGVGNTAASGQVATISNGGLTIVNNYPIRFNNPANTFYTSLKAGANTTNLNLTLPIADGINGQVLSTNGAGVLGFTTVSAGAEPYTPTAYVSSLTFDILSAREKNFDITGFNGNLTIGYSNMNNGAVSSVRLNKTSASALTVTLPTVTNIICNHPDCVVSGDVITITSAAGTKYIISTTKVGNDLIAIVNRVDQDENYGGGGSTITLTTIGTIPNTNAATITGSVLNLQPASELFGGVITTTTQKFAGNKTLVANGSNATSTLTQRSSFKKLFESSLWTGASESKNTFEIYNSASTIVNDESHLAFSYNFNDLFRIKNDGKIWNLPGLIASGKFAITSSTNANIALFDNSNCGFGYDVFNPTYSGNFNFAFGSGGGKFLTTGSRNTFVGSAYAWEITSGNDNLIVGSYTIQNNTVTGSGNIILNTGQVSLTSGNYNINLGNSCVTSTITVSNEFNIGGTSGGFTIPDITNQSISVINIGNGGKNDLYNGTNVLLRVTPTSVINNINGGNLTIGAGGSTGTGIGGSLFWQTSPSGTTGNAVNNLVTRVTIDEKGNFGFNGASFGAGVKVMFMANATTVPNTNPVGGGILYAEGGALKYRGSSGTITIIANA